MESPLESIPLKGYKVLYRSDLVGEERFTEDGLVIIEKEVWYVFIEHESGRRHRHRKTFMGPEAMEEAMRLADTLAGLEAVCAEHFIYLSPAYGSEAYCAEHGF